MLRSLRSDTQVHGGHANRCFSCPPLGSIGSRWACATTSSFAPASPPQKCPWWPPADVEATTVHDQGGCMFASTIGEAYPDGLRARRKTAHGKIWKGGVVKYSLYKLSVPKFHAYFVGPCVTTSCARHSGGGPSCPIVLCFFGRSNSGSFLARSFHRVGRSSWQPRAMMIAKAPLFLGDCPTLLRPKLTRIDKITFL